VDNANAGPEVPRPTKRDELLSAEPTNGSKEEKKQGKWRLDLSVVDNRHLSREASDVPTLHQGIQFRKAKALLSSTSCRDIG
jgi:hypothetical protein